MPDRLLEWSAFDIQRKLEASPLPFEILGKLLYDLAVCGVIHDGTIRNTIPKMNCR